MPNITKFSLEWLSKPHPAHDLFTQKSKAGEQSRSHGGSRGGANDVPGPRRTIARRGTEVFVAVGKEIRWADLVYLKTAQEETQHQRGQKKDSSYGQEHAEGYRTIKTNVADDIRQLIISPRSDYMAIVTVHTIHIAVLPQSSHLTATDTSPLRIKTFTLGPTTHVTSQSALASVLWHPLGVAGLCLVTVTKEAVVRVWELSLADRWSFDRPKLSINLQKLADGTSQEQDFSAFETGLEKSVSFSPDSYEMEVASAAFASRGSGGWSPMTLWIAMSVGDVYALCPLLPEKWSPPPTLIPSLSVSIVGNVAVIEDDPEVSQQQKLLAQQQLDWMSEIDAQEPKLVDGRLGEISEEVYTRPTKPGRIPKLQGPFDFNLAPPESSDELDHQLTDIYVIGPKLDADELMFGEEDELDLDQADDGLSLGVVCLLTRSGRLSIYLDIDGIEAQWLPRTRSPSFRAPDDEDYPSLLTFQVIDTSYSASRGNWPIFSPDLDSRYSFYVTNTSNIVFISLTPWIFQLERELSSSSSAGTDFRINLLAKGHSTIRESIHRQKMHDPSNPLCAATLFRDPDLGFFLLTATAHGPSVVVFSDPLDEDDIFPLHADREKSPIYETESDKPLTIYEPRPVYEAPHALAIESSLPIFISKLRTSKYKRLLMEDVKLSPATLQIMTDAHKILSEETHRVSVAAAELFRRIEGLRGELVEMIQRANEVAARVESVSGEDVKEGPAIGSGDRVEERLRKIQETQEALNKRVENIRKKIGKGGNRDLSAKEKLWHEEVATLESRILGEVDGKAVTIKQAGVRKFKEPWERYEDLQELKEELFEQAQDLTQSDVGSSTFSLSSSVSKGVKVSAGVRRTKLDEVMKLLDREAALVEGTKSRLEKLSIESN